MFRLHLRVETRTKRHLIELRVIRFGIERVRTSTYVIGLVGLAVEHPQQLLALAHGQTVVQVEDRLLPVRVARPRVCADKKQTQ